MQNLNKIFIKGSRTYFYSSLFFPKTIRNDVAILYAFVRTLDDYVDVLPQQKDLFEQMVGWYYDARSGKTIENQIISSFVQLMNLRNFDPIWVDAFIESMRMDLRSTNYHSLAQLEEYIHGSAEVIGLFMSAILGLSPDAHITAMRLGKAMQYINFIRDIREDNSLGRTYFPKEHLDLFGLESLTLSETKANRNQFVDFIHYELQLYSKWQKQAEKGFSYLPKRYLIPVKTASDMYKWTANQIEKNPFILYEKKVRPTIQRILFGVIENTVMIPNQTKHLAKSN
ncbi:MAG: phytoene/squalene synthase family protein [bacterium]